MNPNTPLPPDESMKVRTPLTPALAKHLISNRAKIQGITTTLNALMAADSELVASLAADAGYKIADFASYDYENAKDGSTELVLIKNPSAVSTPQRPA